MNIVFTEEALNDLERIRHFLFDTGNPNYLDVANRILVAAIRLVQHPNIGVRVSRSETNVRDLFFDSYCLRYEVTADKITVLRLWDQREDGRNRTVQEPAA